MEKKVEKIFKYMISNKIEKSRFLIIALIKNEKTILLNL